MARGNLSGREMRYTDGVCVFIGKVGDNMKFTKRGRDAKKRPGVHPKTAIINNLQREKSREAVRHVLKWLSETFPKAFDVEGAIRPLKIGIYNDIMAYVNANGGLTFSMSKLRKALVVFTGRMQYLTCVKMRDMRVDLNGEDVEQVSEEAAKIAAEKIRLSVEKTARSKRRSHSGPRTRRPYSAGPRHHAQGDSQGGAPYQHKRRYSSPYGTSSSSGESSERSERYYGSHYQQDAEGAGSRSSAAPTVMVKKRYTPRGGYDANYQSNQSSSYGQSQDNTYSPNHVQEPEEKNYNSEVYNTEISTVERLKAKLGLKPRRVERNHEE